MTEEYYDDTDIIEKATEELKKLEKTVSALSKKPNPACFHLCNSCQNHGRIVTRKIITHNIETRDDGIQTIAYLLMLQQVSVNEIENLVKALCVLPVKIESNITRA